MAQIAGYEAPQNLGLNPTEIGVDATAAAARRIGAFYNQKADALNDTGARIGSTVRDVGQVALDYMDHREIATGAAHGAEVFDGLIRSKDEAIKGIDPNDPAYGQKVDVAMKQWREEKLAPALETFQQGFNTEKSQAWAEHFVETTRNHMFQSSTADVATAAGIGIHNAVRTIANVSSNTAVLDPSSVPAQLDLVEHSIGGLVDSSAIKGTAGAQLKSEVLESTREKIVKSGAFGAVMKSPNPEKTAAEWTARYPQYINGAESLQLAKAAQVQAKSNALTDKQTLETNRRLEEQNVRAAGNKTFLDNVSIDPQTHQPIIKPQFFDDALNVVRKNPTAPNAAETYRTLTDWGQAQQNKERKVATDPAATSALDGNMFTDNPTTKMDILKAEAAGKLTRSDAEIRSKIIDQRDKLPADPQFKFAMDGAKELIEGRSPGEKSLQAGKYAAFMQQFLGDYQRQKLAGTLPPNALSLRDPNSMLSKAMEAYKSPLASAISGNGGIDTSPNFSDRFTGTASGVAAPATTSKYNPGDVVNTSEGPRRFKGGNFRDKKNWEPVS
jgi:hypothetical protein